MYDLLKILHILSATVLISTGIYCYYLWRYNTAESVALKINFVTWLIILPFAVMQLFSGFMMISIQKYSLSAHWVIVSIVGFLIVTVCWFTFTFFLDENSKHARIIQKTALSILAFSLLIMIFYMANKK